MNNNERQEIEVQVLNYAVDQINQIISLLDHITVSGIENCKSITNIYEILNNPIDPNNISYNNPNEIPLNNNDNDNSDRQPQAELATISSSD